MSQPTGVILSAQFEFTKAGALFDPSPLPALIDARYPDATSPALVGLQHPAVGVFTANVFTAIQSVQIGTYSALAYTSDATADRQYAGYEWVDVGINSVSAFLNGIVSPNSIVVYNALNLATGELTLVQGMAFTVANGNQIDVLTPGNVAINASPTLNMTKPNGSRYQVTGVPAVNVQGQNVARFELQAVDTNSIMGGPSGQWDAWANATSDGKPIFLRGGPLRVAVFV